VADWYQIARRIRVPLGFAFAIFYFWQAHPTWGSLVLGIIVALAGLGIRGVASGHLQKNEQLATSGPYAYVRNPLYLGSVILGIGFAVAARSWWIVLGMVALFSAIYLPVIVSEERFLRANFPEFQEYALRVPRLIPRLRAYNSTAQGIFSRKLYLKHREYNAVLGTIGVVLVLLAKLWFAR